jgi:hypothetical protein
MGLIFGHVGAAWPCAGLCNLTRGQGIIKKSRETNTCSTNWRKLNYIRDTWMAMAYSISAITQRLSVECGTWCGDGVPTCLPTYIPVFPPTYLPTYLPIYLWLYSPFAGPWLLFQFLNLYTVGRTLWTGDQPVARPLPTQNNTNTE